MLRNDDTMGTGKIRCSDDRTKIMGIFYPIQQEDKWCFTLFAGFGQYIIHCGVIISSRNGDHSLMMMCFGKLIQTFF